MAVSEDFRTFVVEQLERVVPPVRTRAMFGGVGIYSDNLFFALMDDDVLYFKVDDGNRPAFVERGMGPFMPFGEDGESMQYYEVPAELLDDAELLRPWAEAAVGVAARARRKRHRPS